MPTITALRPTQRDLSRLTVRVDGKVVATLPAERIGELGLRVGQAWDEALARQVEGAAAYDQTLRRAMNRLSRRMFSRRQLRDRLLRAGQPAQAVDQVLRRLEELALVDDAAYGRALIRETLRAKPAGDRLLRTKLMQRGLDRALVDKLLAEYAGQRGEDEPVQAARALAEKRLATTALRRLDPPARKRRLWGLLARRGFDSEVIEAALADLPALTDDANEA